MTSDKSSYAVCGRSYEQARKLFNELLRSCIKSLESNSNEYRTSIQKLLTDVESFRDIVEDKELSNYPLKDLLWNYGH